MKTKFFIVVSVVTMLMACTHDEPKPSPFPEGEYLPMLEATRWVGIYNDMSSSNFFSFHVINNIGDTIIDSLRFSILRDSVYNGVFIEGSDTVKIRPFFNDHLMREDTAQRATFQKNGKYYYKFPRQIGDSIFSEYILVDVPLITNCGKTRREYIFRPIVQDEEHNDTIIWIEGIGNIADPMHIRANCSNPYERILRVMKGDEIIYDTIVNGISCDDVLDILSRPRI